MVTIRDIARLVILRLTSPIVATIHIEPIDHTIGIKAIVIDIMPIEDIKLLDLGLSKQTIPINTDRS